MGYGDFIPSGGGRPKPLTKAQMRKLQEAYNKADKISENVRALEKIEQRQTEDELRQMLGGL